MPVDRFFIASPFQRGQEVILKDAEFHHLTHVMRLREGDYIELVNGQGVCAQALIKHLEKKQAFLKIESLVNQQKPPRELILAQALPRINRLDFIIEKGTELGATQFWLFPGFHSERKALTEHQMARLHSQAIAAMKQCGRLYLPTFEIKPALDQWENMKIPAYFGDLRPSAEEFSKVLNRRKVRFFLLVPKLAFQKKKSNILLG